MHPHDLTCKWCGFSPLFTIEGGFVQFRTHECPQKPPLTPEEGVAAVFGIIGMFTAIRERYSLGPLSGPDSKG